LGVANPLLPGSAATLSIGGLAVDLDSPDRELAISLAQRYRLFLTDKAADFSVKLNFQPGRNQAGLLDLPFTFRDGGLIYAFPGCEARIDLPNRQAELSMLTREPLQQAEYFLRLVYALLAFEAGGLLLHAAAVVIAGRACIFLGPSGSGKSTVARLAVDFSVLNDDLVMLMPAAGGWVVHATPFWNLPGSAAKTSQADLGGLFCLAHDRRVFLEPLTAGRGAAELIASLPVVNADPQRSGSLIQRCEAILTQFPCWRLHFLPEPSFWSLVCSILEGNPDN
jgi:hypothetical protein